MLKFVPFINFIILNLNMIIVLSDSIDTHPKTIDHLPIDQPEVDRILSKDHVTQNDIDKLEQIFGFEIHNEFEQFHMNHTVCCYENITENVTTNNTQLNESTTRNYPSKPEGGATKKVLRLIKLKPRISQPTFSGFLDFLKSIQQSFMSRTANTIRDKLQMLSEFRDNLLLNIKQRLTLLFPTNVVRSKRSLMDSGHHSMDFPSAEGALITISFLTFAVFLIKLVLQVIHTIKSKHYSYNTFETMAAANSPVKVIKRNRNARRLSMTDQIHLHEMKNILTVL